MTSIKAIRDVFSAGADPERAVQMKAYMRNQFEFFGIGSTQRRELIRPLLKSLDKNEHPDAGLVRQCFSQPEREFQYFAMEYVFHLRKNLNPEDIYIAHDMIISRSWWDTVDYIAAKIIGHLAAEYPEVKEDKISTWITSENMWLRRTSLIFQLGYKLETDPEFLALAIRSNLGSKEFFINKAIGWALRQYSKTNADWVREFIQNNELQPLSRTEGSKYL